MAGCKTPQDVKHFLHTNVFHPNKERILGFIQVSKTEPSSNPFKKKENRHYLCLYVTSTKPYKASIARFIKSETGDSFERRRQWSLEELCKVDGISPDGKSGKFQLQFGAVIFKFEAGNREDKGKFFDDIIEACKRYQEKALPEFVNVKSDVKQLADKVTVEKTQLQKTKEDLVERGEKLSELDKKTADMARSAESFAQNAQKLAEQYQ